MRVFKVVVLSTFVVLSGCAHRTAMTDHSLASFWNGRPLPDDHIAKAEKDWPNDVTLIDMQEGMNLLREGKLEGQDEQRAHSYLERAFLTFEDLRNPDNFSTAFTSDNQTPYRGRPFERVMVASMLGLLDAANGRCDLAISAFRAAEFLDARWKAFSFGTDAPLVYTLLLWCLRDTHAAPDDIARAQEGLSRSLRLQLMLEPLNTEIQQLARSAGGNPAQQVAVALLEVGVPSGLISAPATASVAEIVDMAKAESLRYLTHVLATKDEPYFSTIKPLLKKIDRASGDKVTAIAAAAIEEAFNQIVAEIKTKSVFNDSAIPAFERAKALAKHIDESTKHQMLAFRFEGVGPDIVSEGEYNEIARVVPRSAAYAKAGVAEEDHITLDAPCGLSNKQGMLTVVLCRSRQASAVRSPMTGYKVWSSSYKASTMVGRKFDRILKGRAQFRMGTEVAAAVGGIVAISLLEAGLASRNTGMQIAGAAVGVAAAAAWLAGRATNPEADTRHVRRAFESGYLLIPSR
jgi:hypothetical protein